MLTHLAYYHLLLSQCPKVYFHCFGLILTEACYCVGWSWVCPKGKYTMVWYWPPMRKKKNKIKKKDKKRRANFPQTSLLNFLSSVTDIYSFFFSFFSWLNTMLYLFAQPVNEAFSHVLIRNSFLDHSWVNGHFDLFSFYHASKVMILYGDMHCSRWELSGVSQGCGACIVFKHNAFH